MRFAAGHGDGEPFVCLDAGYDSDCLLRGGEERALFDVQLEMGGHGHVLVGCRVRAQVVDAGELGFHCCWWCFVGGVDFGEVVCC